MAHPDHPAAVPDDVTQLLARFADADRDTAVRTAEVFDAPLLASTVEQVLDTLDGTDEWDQPAQLFLPVPTDRLERLRGASLTDDLRAAGVPDDAVDTTRRALAAGTLHRDATAAFALLQVSLGPGVPYQQLCGMSAPDWAGAAVLVVEGWMHLGGEEESPGGVDLTGAHRRDDGAAECRIVSGATRLGVRASAISVRGVGRLRLDVGPDADDMLVHGRVPAALHRMLGVPAPTLDDRPWLTLAGAWAEIVIGNFARLSDKVGAEAAAVELLKLRPDVAALTWAGARAGLADHLRRAGIDPLDDEAVEDAIRQGRVDPTEARMPTLPLDRILVEGRVDPDELAAFDQVLDRELTSRGGWPAVREAAMAMGRMLRPEDPVPAEHPAWLDATTAILHFGLVADHEPSQLLRQAAGLPRMPGWFRASLRRLRITCEQAYLPAPPNPYLDKPNLDEPRPGGPGHTDPPA